MLTEDQKRNGCVPSRSFSRASYGKVMSFWTPLWVEMKLGFFHHTPESKQSTFALRNRVTETPRIWRYFGTALPFQTRLSQTKPVLPLSNEHGSQVKNQRRRQRCHNKHTKFPYRPTCDVSLLSRQAPYLVICIMDYISGNRKQDTFFRWKSIKKM